jgi:hypothetical protein
MDHHAGHSLDDFADISHTAPPGEEGFDISHEGGEHEIFQDVAASLTQAMGRYATTLFSSILVH